MWISKKKLEAEIRKAANETTLKWADLDAEDKQWRDIEKMKKDIKKLKKWVKNGY